MGTLNKEIDVICVFQRGKIPVPRRFKLHYKDGTYKVIDVDQIRHIEDVTPSGKHNYLYYCTSEVDDRLIDYEIRFFLHDSKWILYRTF